MTDECKMAIEQLTRGQLECLLLVRNHLTSKEIAPILGVSPHTVDQRIRTALRILGCQNRQQAARLVSSPDSNAMFFQLPPKPETLVHRGVVPQAHKRRSQLRLPFTTTEHPRNVM